MKIQISTSTGAVSKPAKKKMKIQISTSTWFEDLDLDEQAAYLKRHPKSKYNKNIATRVVKKTVRGASGKLGDLFDKAVDPKGITPDAKIRQDKIKHKRDLLEFLEKSRTKDGLKGEELTKAIEDHMDRRFKRE